MHKRIKTFSKNIKAFVLLLVLIGGGYVSIWAFSASPFTPGEGLILDIGLNADSYNTGTKTFHDQSGNDNNVVSTNEVNFVPDQYGKSQGAMYFNGVNDQLKIDKSGIVNNPGQLTIAAWFRKDGNDGHTYECVLHQSSNYTIGNSSFWLGLDSGDYFTATIGARTGVGWTAGKTNIKAVIGEWNHLLATWDGSMVKVYLNGVYIKQYNLSSYSNLDTPIRIGVSSDTTYQFNGSVKNILIDDKYFSPEEVQKLYKDSRPKMQVSSIEKGLIGHWSFDKNYYNETTNRITDSSAYGNHATNYGGTFTNDRYGQSNKAISINGSNSRVAISYQNPVYQTSVAAWFKSNGVPVGGYHIITGGYSVEISINSSGFLRTGIVTNTQGRKVFNSGSGLTDGSWHQVALTYDGINLKSFIDGELTATNPVSGTLTGTAQEIGRYLSNAYIANGAIDDVRIYNRAISEEEIKLLYNAKFIKTLSGSSRKGLVFDMPIVSKYTKGGDIGSEIMTDVTPYSNDGENYGASVNFEGAQFDGINDYIVSTNNIGSAGSLPRTFSVWFYPEAQRMQNLLGYGTLSNGRMFDIYLSSNGQIAGHFYSSGFDTLGSDSPIYSLNKWQHFVISYDGVNVYIYYNGEYYKQKTLALDTGISKLFIGKGMWSSPANFYGKISNVKIYNRSLDAIEIKALYDQGHSGMATILGEN